MKRITLNVAAALIGVVVALQLSACVTNPDGTTRPATPDEAAQIVEDATRVVAPTTGPYAPITAAIGGIVAVALREWGRISATKDAAKHKAENDRTWEEAYEKALHLQPPKPTPPPTETQS